MKEEITSEEENPEEIEDVLFEKMSALKVSAPEDSYKRLQKRVRYTQMGKDLLEKQAFGFWKVIDAFLSLIFVSPENRKENSKRGE